MKEIYFKSFTAVLIFTLVLISDLSAQWDTLSTGTNSDLYAVQFINSNTGWITGTGGIIKKSTDGGSSWFSQSSKTLQTLRKIIMFDANTGFICGDSGKILKTTNGGTNWNNTNTGSNIANIYAMDFINASTGICANESRTQFKTTNGGTNWTSSTMVGVNALLSIYGIDMTDANTVYASTGSGLLTSAKVYKSVNFGTSYSASLNDGSNFSSAIINDVKFINSSTGYAGASNNNLARTTDGGTTWTVKSFTRGINQILFTDSQNGYICGEDFFKANTDNSGNTWTIDYNYYTGETLLGMSFISSSTGWMCGSNGRLIKTTNGGGVPPSCNIINSSWINANENVSAGYESAVDDCGNIYVTGFTGSPNKDILTQKYSSSGYLYWSKTYNGSGNGDDEGTQIKLDNDGNVFVAGYATGSKTLKDFVLIKYLPDGQREWVRTYDATACEDVTADLAIDSSGNALVFGNTFFDRLFLTYRYATILKYNNTGDLQWSRKIGGGSSDTFTARRIVCNNANNIYIALNYVDVDLSFNDQYGLVYKFNSSGTELWSVSEDSISFSGLVIGNSGNIYVTGSNGEPSNNSANLVTIKYNTSGVQQWIRYLDGGLSQNDVPTSMNISGGGQLVITAHTSYYSFIFPLADSYVLTVKYDSDGELQWYQRYKSPQSYFNYPSDLARDTSGNIYITGHRRDSISPHRSDIMTMKYNSTGTSLDVNLYDAAGDNDEGNSINIDNTGNVFVTGYSSNPSSYCTVIKYSPSDFSFSRTLNLSALVQGFYNSATDLMVQDTTTIYLRNSALPYAIVDSAKALLSNTGTGTFSFLNALDGVGYYIQVKHRNSIETWSKTPQQFAANSLTYEFTTANTQAFGDNIIQVDASPVRFAVFGGDVNQDGTVDATDVSTIDNDASNFVGGYVVTDLTGDDFVDGTDFAIADNNAANFVSVVRP